jgi:hypothetical protein
VPPRLGYRIDRATVDGDSVRLGLVSDAEAVEELAADHVVAATGYRVDVTRLGFLAPELLPRVRNAQGPPMLNRRFESTVPGLFFVGLVAAASFGPVMRFVYGAGFTSRTLTRALTHAR